MCPLRGGSPHTRIAVAYKRALRLTRRIYVPAACRAAHPDGMLALRRVIELGRCGTAGSNCQREKNWATFVERASRRSNKRGWRKYVALVTPEEMNQEPYNTLPRVCRQTFGAFARDLAQIIPSRGPRPAGGGHDSGECDLGKPRRGPGIRNPPSQNENVGMCPLVRSH